MLTQERKNKTFAQVCVIFAVIHASVSLANIAPLSNSNAASHSLSETMKDQFLGLDFESGEVKKKSIGFARICKKIKQGESDLTEKKRFLQNCDRDPIQNSFCLVLKDWDRKEKSRPARSPLTWLMDRVPFKKKIVEHWIKEGRLDQFSKRPEREFRQGLKSVSASSDLNPMVAAILSASSCQYSGFSQILGSKLEEFLPDPDVQKRMLDLYEKSARCNEGENSKRAHFRLGLHYISQGSCDAANPHLDRLIDGKISGKVRSKIQAKSPDYRARALFWRFQCAEKQKKLSDAKDAKQTLLKDYPFSFHNILAQKTSQVQSEPVKLHADSKIRFRSVLKPNLNGKIRVIEAFCVLGEFELARKVIGSIEKDLFEAEPEFRLYLAVLNYRMNAHLRNFSLLSSVFRDNPELVSKPALELNFPLNVLRPDHLSKTGVDSHLLLSLMRQESAFNARAVSSAGALGLMQVMPRTARKLEGFFHRKRLLEPDFNLRVGAKYFSSLLERYQGDAELALAAYNAGPARVDIWLKRYPVSDRILFMDLIPFTETRDYVAAIGRNYYWYMQLYADSFAKGNVLQAEEKMSDRKLGNVFRLLGG